MPLFWNESKYTKNLEDTLSVPFFELTWPRSRDFPAAKNPPNQPPAASLFLIRQQQHKTFPRDNEAISMRGSYQEVASLRSAHRREGQTSLAPGRQCSHGILPNGFN